MSTGIRPHRKFPSWEETESGGVDAIHKLNRYRKVVKQACEALKEGWRSEEPANQRKLF